MFLRTLDGKRYHHSLVAALLAIPKNGQALVHGLCQPVPRRLQLTQQPSLSSYLSVSEATSALINHLGQCKVIQDV